MDNNYNYMNNLYHMGTKVNTLAIMLDPQNERFITAEKILEHIPEDFIEGWYVQIRNEEHTFHYSLKPTDVMRIAIALKNDSIQLSEKWETFIKNNRSMYNRIVRDLINKGYELNTDIINIKDTQKTYSRKNADKALQTLQDKIDTVNNGSYIYYIDKVVLYGSYINAPQKEKIGDVDIAVFISLKDNSISEFDQNELRYALAGKTFEGGIRNLLIRKEYGITEIKKVLRKGTPIIAPDFVYSKKDNDDYINQVIYSKKHKTIYERIPDKH